ncbi:MAG: DUF4382 domain-containing protein [Candidatus Bathyarchaeia archaeon]
MKTENGIKIGAYAAAGVLIAAIIIAGLYVSGIKLPASKPTSSTGESETQPSSMEHGTLIVLVTDAPANLSNLYLTIDKISIQGSGGNWTELELLDQKENITFDLLALQNISMCLSVTEIPAGNYTMLKMHVLNASTTYADGNVVDLRVPSEEVKVLFKPHLKMESNGTITVTIDLEPDTVNIARNRELNLKPVVKAIVKTGQ